MMSLPEAPLGTVKNNDMENSASFLDAFGEIWIYSSDIVRIKFEIIMDIEINADQLRATLLTFPCFSDADPQMAASELMELVLNAFNEDNLTEEQDLVVEMFLHLNTGEVEFNLKRALEIWMPEDRDAFIELISAPGLKQQ